MTNLFETSLNKMLRETFEGSANPKETWFTNNDVNSGIFGTIEGLSAEEASVFVHGTTLAAHTNHIRYHMWGTNELLKSGNYPKMDWEKSWATTSVSELHWKEIQENLQCEYAKLMEALDVIEWNEQLSDEVLASLAHSAYHLGAIRQILKIIKKY